jgi:hypothetical protein
VAWVSAQSAESDTNMNGKGDAPRNCFSAEFRDGYDNINWSKKSTPVVEIRIDTSGWNNQPQNKEYYYAKIA